MYIKWALKIKSTKGLIRMKKKIDLTRYRRLAKIFEVIARVFFWTSVICAVCSFIAGIAVQFLNDSVFIIKPTGNSAAGFTLSGVISYKITSSNPAANIRPVMTAVFFMAIVICAIIAPIFKQIELILKTVRNDRPFSFENANRLNIIGFVLMAGAFVIKIAESLVASTMIDTFKLDHLAVTYTPDDMMIVVAFLIFILSGVFKYGSYLQHEYDSTV